MTKFVELNSQKIYTVEQLIKELEKLPFGTLLNSRDADIGGYDVSTANYGIIEFDKESNSITIGHLEHDAYTSLSKKEITQEEYNLLTGEKR